MKSTYAILPNPRQVYVSGPTSFVGTTFFTPSSRTCCTCTYKPSGFTVSAVCGVRLRPYQPCYEYIGMHEIASLSTMIREKKKSLCTVQKACQPAKHKFSHCTQQNRGMSHNKTSSCLPWRILFYAQLTTTSCSLSTAQGTIRCSRTRCFYLCRQYCAGLQKRSAHTVYSISGCLSRH